MKYGRLGMIALAALTFGAMPAKAQFPHLSVMGGVNFPKGDASSGEDMGYNGSVTNAKIPPETEKRIGFNADERKRLIDLDYAYLAKNDAALKEWWDKTLKG